MADTFNDVMMTTLAAIQPKLYMNIMQSTPFLKLMFERGKVVEINGGTQIEVILANKENENVQWGDMGDILPTSRNAVLTKAIYPWKILDCTVSILEDEIAINREPAKILNLVKTLLEVQEISCKNAMSKALYSDGSDPKSINGLQLFIADDPTKGVVGGIDRASNEWWRNKATELTSPSAAMLVDAMNDMILKVTIDVDRPTAIVMDANYYRLYQSTLQTIQRIMDAKKGDAGFQALDFQGVPVIYDPSCPANHAYFVNDNYLQPATLSGFNFKLLDPRPGYNQLVRLYILHFIGNLILKDSRRQGVIFTAPKSADNGAQAPGNKAGQPVANKGSAPVKQAV